MTRRCPSTLSDPDSLRYELGATVRQRLWRVCCQSIEEHRFDCPAVDPEQRGDGPFGPVAPQTPADLVARLRSA